ncbi:unnamed protein product [Meloidogyne enterolobii]|uniref:Uncharacterized protein n=1 Tax=Meloidogyne enterolobii TaxID=390850 RepID=A0ACB0YGT5_MELEN
MSYLASIVAAQNMGDSDQEFEDEMEGEIEYEGEGGQGEENELNKVGMEEEVTDEEEYEYIYEEYSEEEEEEIENNLNISENCGDDDGDKIIVNNNSSILSTRSVVEEAVLDERLRRLIEAPQDEFERESALNLQLGNNAFWIPDKENSFRLCRIDGNANKLICEQQIEVEIINEMGNEKEARDCGDDCKKVKNKFKNFKENLN